MTIREYTRLFEAFVDEEQKEIQRIFAAVSDPASIPLSTANEALSYHEGVRWAYQNVVTLLSQSFIAEQIYNKRFKKGDQTDDN